MLGPKDLTLPMGWLLRRAFGMDDTKADTLQKASPVQYIQPGQPPFPILHGEQDSAVPVEQAQRI